MVKLVINHIFTLHFTHRLIAKGASGGAGVQDNEDTRGATARGVFYLKEGTDLHILVGQEGQSPCAETKVN